MSRIYSQASAVLVWLGLNDPDPGFDLFDVHRIDRLERVLHSQYWQRLWTVQEFELAQEILVMEGSKTIALDDMLDDINRYHSGVKYELQDRGYTLEETLRHEVIDRLLHRGEMTDTSLEKLVLRYNQMQCADPRDTVYGLLGLATCNRSPGDGELLQPDYSLTPKQLCERLEELGIKSWRLAPSLREAARLDAASR
jgi:hypothetical protein